MSKVYPNERALPNGVATANIPDIDRWKRDRAVILAAFSFWKRGHPPWEGWGKFLVAETLEEKAVFDIFFASVMDKRAQTLASSLKG